MSAKTGLVGAQAVGALVAAAVLLAPATASGQELDGQALFVETYKCNTCHAVAGADIQHKVERTKGPDLSGYATEDFDGLASFLRKQEQREGEDHKKTYAGSDEELQAILDWLATFEPVATAPPAG